LSGKKSGKFRGAGIALDADCLLEGDELPDIVEKFQGGLGGNRWGCGVVFVGDSHGRSFIFAHYSPEQGEGQKKRWVKENQKSGYPVIPAEAGIQSSEIVVEILDPGFHRGDDLL
jgi:hypothetical protein